MVKIIMLDVANTLLGKPEVFLEIQQYCLELGLNIPKEVIKERHKILSEITHFPDKTSLEFYIDFNYRLLLSLGVCASKEMAEQLFKKCTYKPWVPFDDCAALRDLKLNFGILSNWDYSLNKRLKEFFPEINFEPIIVSSEVGFQKPDEEIFNIAIERCGLNANEIVFVGDSIRLDYFPSRKTGIKSILIDRENAFPNFNGIRISSLYELKDAIDGIK